MSDYEVEVLVRGRPVKVFTHKGDRFIEGRHGSSFELKITNNTWNRIEVVTSVDGLSVVNGEECGSDSEGYLVPAKESIVIPGWRLPNDRAAEFIFEDKRKSYSNQVGKGTQNVGVIGFMVFKEKVEAAVKIISTPTPIPYPQPYPVPYPVPTPWYPRPWPYDYWTNNTVWVNNEPYYSTYNNSITRGIDNVNIGASSGMTGAAHNMAQASCDSVASHTIDSLSISSGDLNSTSVLASSVQPEPNFEIGTGWGDEIDHKVSEVKFERVDRFNPDKILSVFYDTKNGLESRGIQVIKTKKKKVSSLPNAFPTYKNSVFAPPPNWKGKK